MPEQTTSVETQARRGSRDSISNTLFIAISVSLVCSILVASVAVVLKPRQENNEREYRQRIILEVAGLMHPGADVEALSEKIEPRMVELASGQYVDSPAPDGFDEVVAARSEEMGIAIPPELDLGGIHRRTLYAPVYLVRPNEEVEQIILPVYGSGLWSTIRGYLALNTDGSSVTGLRFYSHGETPGLGDQIDDPDWLQKWEGKVLFDADGKPQIEVIRGAVRFSGDMQHDHATRFQVDGLSGATLTGRGVTRLIQYWTGPHGFGPYLENQRRADGGEQ